MFGRSIKLGFLLCAAVLLCGGPVMAQEQRSLVDYEPYARVLKNYVDEQGRVDYAGLRNNRGDLNRFMDEIKNISVNFLDSKEQLAFWLNAYNAITLDVVVDAYPVGGIRRINFGLVWEIPRPVAQTKHSLSHIEHKIVRPMGDPRVHFALNCASIGCPRLPREPFYADRLDEQLERETVEFINDPDKVRIDRATNTLYYSAIFSWFEEDFLKVAPSIKVYIARYLTDEEEREYLESTDVDTQVMKYDWGLNEQK